MNIEEIRRQNRRSWDAVVPAHMSHHTELAAFLAAGGSTLFPEESELLGSLEGLRLAHLMCNTGQDTLSLAARGARALGVDASPVAIDYARELSRESGIQAAFVCADVYEWLEQTVASSQSYDRVFCSYGIICWLPELSSWAQGLAAVLTDGGRFVLVEFHPVSNMFDADGRWVRDYPYAGRMLSLPGIDDYVAASEGGLTPSGFQTGVQSFHNPEPCYLFQWSVGEVVTALARAGLRIELVQEYPYVNGERPFHNMRTIGTRRLTLPEHLPQMPLMYAIVASKAGK